MVRTFAWYVLAAFVISSPGCAGSQPATQDAASKDEVVEAYVELNPVRSRNIRGVIEFESVDHGLLLKGHVKGLSYGRQGFGVLARSECLTPEGKAGNFFDPDQTKGRPLGDLGNIVGEQSGVTRIHQVETKLSLEGPASIIGKTLGITLWPNEPETDPNEVPLAACGVIRAK